MLKMREHSAWHMAPLSSNVGCSSCSSSSSCCCCWLGDKYSTFKLYTCLPTTCLLVRAAQPKKQAPNLRFHVQPGDIRFQTLCQSRTTDIGLIFQQVLQFIILNEGLARTRSRHAKYRSLHPRYSRPMFLFRMLL